MQPRSRPTTPHALEDERALNDLEWIKQTIIAVRNIRAEMNIAQKTARRAAAQSRSADIQHRVPGRTKLSPSGAPWESIALLLFSVRKPGLRHQAGGWRRAADPDSGFSSTRREIARLAKRWANWMRKSLRSKASWRTKASWRARGSGDRQGAIVWRPAKRQSEAAGTSRRPSYAVIHRLTPAPEKRRIFPLFYHRCIGPG